MSVLVLFPSVEVVMEQLSVCSGIDPDLYYLVGGVG